jgi:carbamoyltransferase
VIILGISAYYHDAAAAIIIDGKIIAAAQEERFTRIKNDPSFPSSAIRFCLDFANVTLDDVDAVVFYDKPFLKFERLLETFYANAPRGLGTFLKAMPVWMKEKLLLKTILRKELSPISPFNRAKTRLLFTEHHLSHAASAFYPSPFRDAAVLTIDGVGEWATASICHGSDNNLTMLRQLDFPHSLGLLYAAFTYYCGFEVNGGEYKLMGLAPYGDRSGERYAGITRILREKLTTLAEDGSLKLHQTFFNYAVGSRMVKDEQWTKLFGFGRRTSNNEPAQEYADMAAAIQDFTTDAVIRMAREAQRLTGSRNLCLAGGVALNCVANGELQTQKIFDRIFIQPSAGDAGGAIGAALAGYHIFHKKNRILFDDVDGMKGSLLGPQFSNDDIIRSARRFTHLRHEELPYEALTDRVSELLASGKVIGWFQGRAEFGPRALGNRSILADPRAEDMQKRLNLMVKHREGFRPFAPAVLDHRAADYFEIDVPSPYMLLVKPLRREYRIPLTGSSAASGIMQKLYARRSQLPAITHVDYSARLQTVTQSSNPLFFELISKFGAITGVPMLVNTSFNVKDEPIVNSPDDAFRCFANTGIDYLAIGNFLFSKASDNQDGISS